MAPVPRKAGRPLGVDNARGVLCTNAASKRFGRLLRPELKEATTAEVAGSQFGAIAGGGTEQPSHFARTFRLQAHVGWAAVALLFADVKAALYSVWPKIALGLLVSEDQRLAIFRAAGLEDVQAARLVTLMEEDTALRRRGVDGSWRHLAADWHDFVVGDGTLGTHM